MLVPKGLNLGLIFLDAGQITNHAFPREGPPLLAVDWCSVMKMTESSGPAAAHNQVIFQEASTGCQPGWSWAGVSSRRVKQVVVD